MAVKTITITERAYKVLEKKKKGNESFSSAILGMAGKSSLLEFYGALSLESGGRLAETVSDMRKKRNMLRRNAWGPD